MAFMKTDDGVELYYEDLGRGERAVVFVHGYMDSGASFQFTARHLSEKYRVVLYDERAHGKSGVSQEGYTMRRYAQDLKNLIDHLGLGSVSLVGYSMGAHVVYSYIEQFGEELLDKIIITVMSPKMITDADYHLGMYGNFPLEHALKVLALTNSSFRTYCQMGMKGYAALIERYAYLRQYFEAAAALDPNAMLRLQIAMLEGDYWPVLASITRPTLLVTGENDIYPLEAFEEQQRRIRHARLVRLPECGHMLAIECPERYAAEISSFLG